MVRRVSRCATSDTVPLPLHTDTTGHADLMMGTHGAEKGGNSEAEASTRCVPVF